MWLITWLIWSKFTVIESISAHISLIVSSTSLFSATLEGFTDSVVTDGYTVSDFKGVSIVYYDGY